MSARWAQIYVNKSLLPLNINPFLPYPALQSRLAVVPAGNGPMVWALEYWRRPFSGGSSPKMQVWPAVPKAAVVPKGVRVAPKRQSIIPFRILEYWWDLNMPGSREFACTTPVARHWPS
jgi:hypothetical protein